ncbi:Uncharacterized protein PBTT_06899 [Plasmodiophora brassicae]
MAAAASPPKGQAALEALVRKSLAGIRVTKSGGKLEFSANADEVESLPTPKDMIMPAPVVLIANLYAESLREIEREEGGMAVPVYAGGMALLGMLPAMQCEFKTAVKAMQRVFNVAKRRGIDVVNQDAFAAWQSACLRKFDKRSVAMLMVDANGATVETRDMLRRFGYECPADADAP